MTTLDQPRQIVEYCLKPLELADTAGAAEARRRLMHVIHTLQLAAGPRPRPAVDFSKMPAIVINEAAHGDDA